MEGKARIKRDKHAGNVRQSAQLNRAEGLRPFYFPSLDVFLCFTPKAETAKFPKKVFVPLDKAKNS